MKIRILQTVLIGGKGAMPGAVVEVPEQAAAGLIRRGLAEQAEEGPPPREGTFLDSEAPEPEPARRGKRK